MVCVAKAKTEQEMNMSEIEIDEDEAGMDPAEAARLLERTTRDAQRGLNFRSPWLSLLAALMVLVALGAAWLSVRGQHPYKGPTPLGLLGLYAALAVRIGSVIYAHHRATAGVSGSSVRRRRAEGTGLVAALIAVYVVMGALANDGASDGIVYGVYVLTATLIVLGAFWAGRSAAREDWQELWMAVAILLVAAGSAFAGPRGVWLSDGIGLCIVLIGHGAAQAWQRHVARSGA
jgi:hypothetical protein